MILVICNYSPAEPWGLMKYGHNYYPLKGRIPMAPTMCPHYNMLFILHIQKIIIQKKTSVNMYIMSSKTQYSDIAPYH